MLLEAVACTWVQGESQVEVQPPGRAHRAGHVGSTHTAGARGSPVSPAYVPTGVGTPGRRAIGEPGAGAQPKVDGSEQVVVGPCSRVVYRGILGQGLACPAQPGRVSSCRPATLPKIISRAKHKAAHPPARFQFMFPSNVAIWRHTCGKKVATHTGATSLLASRAWGAACYARPPHAQRRCVAWLAGQGGGWAPSRRSRG